LNTSLAEGWGLVSFEHAATGAAQIVPGFGNCEELWRGAAELFPQALTLFHKDFRFEEKLIAPQSVAEAIERLYRDPGYRRHQALAAYTRACDPELTPGLQAQRWRGVFASMLCTQSTVATNTQPHS
jgi:hypothetical protein